MADAAAVSEGRTFGCIEAGGTKFVVGIARGPAEIMRTTRIATARPAETIASSIAFLRAAAATFGPIASIGIASFGPVGLRHDEPGWGHVLDTPKPGWSGTNMAGPFALAFGCPVGFDTDVNAAVLAEARWGAAAGVDLATYVTVGTGIGGGVLVSGMPIHGARHPEMGHIRVARHAADREFAGICPFHGDCLEGLASGPAIAARWGRTLSELAEHDHAHEIIAFYLAQLVIAQQALLSPQRIVMGGGVLATPGLIDRVRFMAARLAAQYFGTSDQGYASLIVAPGLGEQAGLLGALALAMKAA